MSSLYTIPNSTTGLDTILVDTIEATDVGPFPGFATLLLFFVFFTVWLGGMARQRMRSGTADGAMWAVVASLTTFMTTLIMTMISGFVSVVTLSVVITVSVFSVAWLWLSHRQSEL